MFNFFVDEKNKSGNCYNIQGKDFNHIKNVLRMNEGDTFLVSCGGTSDLCKIILIDSDTITAEIVEENYNNTELPVEITLFQGLPKADKMELIIKHTTELGVSKIVPTEMKRCVVKLDDKKKNSKVARWQTIAESAAKQSKRNIIPTVSSVMSFKEMLSTIKDYDLFIIPYENKEGMTATKEVLCEIKKGMKIAILIGSEGGFDEKEITKAVSFGGKTVSLGKRILRTETAAITAVGMVMLYTEANLGGEDK